MTKRLSARGVLLKKTLSVSRKKLRGLRMLGTMARFKVANHEQYLQLNRLANKLSTLADCMRKLPDSSTCKAELQTNLASLTQALGLAIPEEGPQFATYSFSSLQSRCIASVLLSKNYVPDTNTAFEVVETGQVMIGNAVVSNPYMLIPKALELKIHWAKGSSVKKTVAELRDCNDDFEQHA